MLSRIYKNVNIYHLCHSVARKHTRTVYFSHSLSLLSRSLISLSPSLSLSLSHSMFISLTSKTHTHTISFSVARTSCTAYTQCRPYALVLSVSSFRSALLSFSCVSNNGHSLFFFFLFFFSSDEIMISARTLRRGRVGFNAPGRRNILFRTAPCGARAQDEPTGFATPKLRVAFGCYQFVFKIFSRFVRFAGQISKT